MPASAPILTVDPLAFSLRALGGVARVWRNLLPRLVESDVPVRLTGGIEGQAILSNGLDAAVRASEKSDRIPPVVRRFVTYRGDGEVFFPTYFRPCRPGVPNIQLVHDCIKELYYPSAKAMLSRWRKRRLYQNASRLIAISEATRLDLQRLHGERIEDRIRVIHNPVDRDYVHRCAAAGRAHPEFERLHTLIGGRPFAMFIGFRASWKNFREVKHLLAALPDHLVVAVGPPPTRAELQFAEATPGRVVYAVRSPDAAMFALLAASDFLFFPSMLEGFGLPVIESLFLGTPVLGLDTQVNREISLGLMRTFESGSPRSIAEAAAGARRHDPEAPHLQELAMRYDPDRVARAYLQVVRELL